MSERRIWSGAVPVPLRRTFHYEIPAALGEPRRGARVIPFEAQLHFTPGPAKTGKELPAIAKTVWPDGVLQFITQGQRVAAVLAPSESQVGTAGLSREQFRAGAGAHHGVANGQLGQVSAMVPQKK